MKNYICVTILLISALSFFIMGCGDKNPTISSTDIATPELPKGGPGTGMFEFPKQNSITITYNKKVYQITDPTKFNQIIALCKNYNWPEDTSKSYNKEDCNVWIDFNTGRAVLGFISTSSHGILNNDSFVIIPNELMNLVSKCINS